MKITDKDFPSLIVLEKCNGISIDGILFQQFVNKALISKGSKHIQLRNLTIKSQVPQAVGLRLEESTDVQLAQIYFDTPAKSIEKDEQSSFSSVEKCITANGKSAL